jgi:hypothetical protein
VYVQLVRLHDLETGRERKVVHQMQRLDLALEAEHEVG